MVSLYNLKEVSTNCLFSTKNLTKERNLYSIMYYNIRQDLLKYPPSRLRTLFFWKPCPTRSFFYKFLNNSTIWAVISSQFFSLLLGMQNFDLDVLLFMEDLPARLKCSCINSCVGYYACTHCLFSGVRCNQHKHALYPWTEFRRDPPRRRMQKNILECVR
jgi:hypothetical protein